MTQGIVSTSQTILVAIDMAKYQHQVLIEYPNGSRKSLSIKNAVADYQRLLNLIQKENMQTIVGFEATADYHRCLAYFLQSHHIVCKLISSIACARTRETLYNTWDKHDHKDSQVIMHLLKTDVTQIYYDPLHYHINDWQELSNTYHQVSKRKTRLHHSLKNHYFALYFPEAEKYMHSTRALWFINLLLLFPCPESIRKVSLEEFIARCSKISGKKVNKQLWLQDFYHSACHSVGLPVSPDGESIQMFLSVLREYQHICVLRDTIEKRAITLLGNHPDFQRLQTIPGIGPIIALTILAEVGDLRRFRHCRQLIKYCGFDLSTQQSGTLRGHTRLSKRGNARLRQALWMAAQVAVSRPENTFRRKFKAYTEKCPDNKDVKRKAYTNIAVKMVRVIYAIISKQTDYRGYYESH